MSKEQSFRVGDQCPRCAVGYLSFTLTCVACKFEVQKVHDWDALDEEAWKKMQEEAREMGEMVKYDRLHEVCFSCGGAKLLEAKGKEGKVYCLSCRSTYDQFIYVEKREGKADRVLSTVEMDILRAKDKLPSEWERAMKKRMGNETTAMVLTDKRDRCGKYCPHCAQDKLVVFSGDGALLRCYSCERSFQRYGTETTGVKFEMAHKDAYSEYDAWDINSHCGATGNWSYADAGYYGKDDIAEECNGLFPPPTLKGPTAVFPIPEELAA